MRLLRRSYAYHAIASRVAISIENRFVGQVTASAWVGDHAATRIVARQMAEMCLKSLKRLKSARPVPEDGPALIGAIEQSRRTPESRRCIFICRTIAAVRKRKMLEIGHRHFPLHDEYAGLHQEGAIAARAYLYTDVVGDG